MLEKVEIGVVVAHSPTSAVVPDFRTPIETKPPPKKLLALHTPTHKECCLFARSAFFFLFLFLFFTVDIVFFFFFFNFN